LADIAASIPGIPGSAIHRALDPDGWWWDQADELLATIVDRLGLMIWQAAGRESQPLPDPYPRPGAPDPDDDWTPDSSFDTPADYDQWRSSVYQPEGGDDVW